MFTYPVLPENMISMVTVDLSAEICTVLMILTKHYSQSDNRSKRQKTAIILFSWYEVSPAGHVCVICNRIYMRT